MNTPQDKLNKLAVFKKDKDFAIFSEQMELNDKIEGVITAIKEIPKTEIPEQKEIDISATNKLLESLIEEIKKLNEDLLEIKGQLIAVKELFSKSISVNPTNIIDVEPK